MKTLLSRLAPKMVPLFLSVAFLVAGMPAHAAITINEDFNYGASNQPLSGLNGGTGFSAAWTGAHTYSALGLVLSDLISEGGAVLMSGDRTSASRTFSASLATPIYGSFLFNAPTTFAGDQTDVLLCAAACNDQDANVAFNLGSGAKSITGGLSTGVTYLVLFQAVLNGGGLRDWTAWVLNAAQYDSFKPGGFDVTAMNAAAIGTGATNVSNRYQQLNRPAIGLNNATLYRFDGPAVTVDRLQISATGFADLTQAVPEPSTYAMAALGLALLARAARQRRRA